MLQMALDPLVDLEDTKAVTTLVPPYSALAPVRWVQHGAFVAFVSLMLALYVVDLVAMVCSLGLWTLLRTSLPRALPRSYWRHWFTPPGPATGRAEGDSRAGQPPMTRARVAMEALGLVLYLQAVPTALRAHVWRSDDSPPGRLVHTIEGWTLAAATLPSTLSVSAQTNLLFALMILVPLVVVLYIVVWVLVTEDSTAMVGIVVFSVLPLFGDAIGTMLRLVDGLELNSRTFAVSTSSLVLSSAAVLLTGGCFLGRGGCVLLCWVHGCMGAWVHGCMGDGCLGAGGHGGMGAWVHVCVGAWGHGGMGVHGCVDAWVHECGMAGY